MDSREEIERLVMHCSHDTRFLTHIIEEYLRYRDDKREVESLTYKALKEIRELMKLLWGRKIEPRKEGEESYILDEDE
jgi:hypothetical protein